MRYVGGIVFSHTVSYKFDRPVGCTYLYVYIYISGILQGILSGILEAIGYSEKERDGTYIYKYIYIMHI